jgi:hypothetical protein
MGQSLAGRKLTGSTEFTARQFVSVRGWLAVFVLTHMTKKSLSTYLPANASIDATEIMYLIGLAFLFVGLWVLSGIGLSLTVEGAVLIASALLNAWQREAHHVI